MKKFLIIILIIFVHSQVLADKDQKIARPRQVYTGYDSRDYVNMESR